VGERTRKKKCPKVLEDREYDVKLRERAGSAHARTPKLFFQEVEKGKETPKLIDNAGS
jgi:hypothetical protein